MSAARTKPPRPRALGAATGPAALTLLAFLGAGSSFAPARPEAGASSVSAPAAAAPAPARPAACLDVSPGALAEALAAAEDGAALCLLAGRHPGPLTVARRVTLWGTPDAIVASSGEGTTVRIEAHGCRLLGFTVDGSGGRFDRLDAAVHVQADDVVIDSLDVRNAVFGLLLEKSNRATVRHCKVGGVGRGPLGLRGDAIRLWETRDSLIEGNHVVGSRDVVVWYSPNNRLVGNVVEASRYGTHFMYSHRCVVEGNRYVGNVVGVFIMYSHDLDVRDNVMALGTGASGMGIGLKESGNIRIEGNLIARNTRGLYVDTSPLQLTDHNSFTGNAVVQCDVAVLFHSSELRNTFSGNSFRGNQLQVQVDGGGNARGVAWDRNHFDDYQGYDLDGDGLGDVPYQLADYSGHLEGKHPQLALFHGSATLGLVDAVSRAFPLLRPPIVLEDLHPLVHPPPETAARAR